MEYIDREPERSDKSWRYYLLVLGLVLGSLVVLQLYSTNAGPGESSKDPWQSIMSGDLEVKQAICGLPGFNTKTSARSAISTYEEAVPWPAAYRRIAIVKKVILKEDRVPEFDKIASPAAIKLAGHSKSLKLKQEVAMWNDIFKPGGISKSVSRKYISKIKKLNIGPLQQTAAAEVYARSGQPQKAAQARESAKNAAANLLVGFGALSICLITAGVIGLIIAFRFLAIYSESLKRAPPPRIQSSVLLITFIVYMVSFVLLEIITGVIGNISPNSSMLTLGLEAAAILGAFSLGLAALRTLTAYTGEDMRDIGFKHILVGRDVKWGLGGFCAVIPFLAVALTITAIMSQTIFKNFKTPEQPFGPMIATGGAGTIVMVFLLAMVLAPLVEETFFRGALYTAFRGKMGVWPAVFFSAGIFAIIHPLPGGFLPIFVLASVFALLREKTDSLLPSMVCHSLYNGILLLITLLVY